MRRHEIKAGGPQTIAQISLTQIVTAQRRRDQSCWIKPADDSADEFEQAKRVMLQIHDLLAAYPGMAAHIAEHVPGFYSASVAGLISQVLKSVPTLAGGRATGETFAVGEW